MNQIFLAIQGIAMNVSEIRAWLAQAEFAARDYAHLQATKARSEGRVREAISWEARVRRVDKTIAQYKMERYRAAKS